MFGSAITQQPYLSRAADIQHANPAFRLKPDGLPLLALISSWRALVAAQHPLMESYGAVTVNTAEAPRARLLMLLQAIEGLYGHENSTILQQNQGKFDKKRKAVVDAVQENAALDPAVKKFITDVRPPVFRSN